MSFGPFGDRAHVTFAVSFGVVALMAVAVSSSGSLPGDAAAADLAGSVRAGWLDEVMRAVTDVGAGAVVATILAFASLGLAANRKWWELAATVTGAVVIGVGVPELKDGVGRARPEGGLVGTDSPAFPSGHAAYATAYAYLALLVAHLAPPARRLTGPLIAAGVALTLSIASSRVYLGVHYLSDVIAGLAFGVGAFTLWAVLALARTRLRQNLDSG